MSCGAQEQYDVSRALADDLLLFVRTALTRYSGYGVGGREGGLFSLGGRRVGAAERCVCCVSCVAACRYVSSSRALRTHTRPSKRRQMGLSTPLASGLLLLLAAQANAQGVEVTAATWSAEDGASNRTPRAD